MAPSERMITRIFFNRGKEISLLCYSTGRAVYVDHVIWARKRRFEESCSILCFKSSSQRSEGWRRFLPKGCGTTLEETTLFIFGTCSSFDIIEHTFTCQVRATIGTSFWRCALETQVSHLTDTPHYPARVCCLRARV